MGHLFRRDVDNRKTAHWHQVLHLYLTSAFIELMLLDMSISLVETYRVLTKRCIGLLTLLLSAFVRGNLVL